MKTYHYRTHESFLKEAFIGNKKHEYRLATPENTCVEIGDLLRLISSDDRSYYCDCFVTSVKIFKDWKEALSDTWDSDFINLFSSFDDVLSFVSEFYSDDLVEKFGIVSFEIVPVLLGGYIM